MVPVVSEKGTKLTPEQAAKKKAKAAAADRKTAHPQKSDAKPFDKNRPDLWDPPKNATPERLAEWTKLRAKVAKKLGVKLVK
jgi:hypothetical protein